MCVLKNSHTTLVCFNYCILQMKVCTIGIFDIYSDLKLEILLGSKLSYLTIERHNTVGSFHSVVDWMKCNHVTAVSNSDCSQWLLN